MKCLVSGVGHDLIIPNIEVIYRDTCDETITAPVVTEVSGATGQCNKRIITIPCNGCEKCRKTKAYGCRIKTCTLDDGRNTKTREPYLLELSDANCTIFTTGMSGISGTTFADISTFETFVCDQLETIGLTGLFGTVVIRGPLPAFDVPFTVASIQDGVCTEAGITTFTAGLYRLENCGDTTTFEITNSSP